MTLIALPALNDNYIWMLHDGRDAAVVDPGDAGPVMEALSRLSLRLTAILVTHHHPDHVAGIPALRPVLEGPVHAPTAESVKGHCTTHDEGDAFDLLGLRFDVIQVPGHTLDHVAYMHRGSAAQAPLVFCGDTLFSAGCGRLFEGTPAQMLGSLDKLAALPDDTQVCCTHEYTLANLRFAHAVEPDNPAVNDRRRQCEQLRQQGLPTLPVRLGDERRYNPFLRCAEPGVVAAALAQGAEGSERLPVFTALRRWKDRS